MKKMWTKLLVTALAVCMTLSVAFAGNAYAEETDTLNATMNYLVEECGPRLAATPNEDKAAAYIKAHYEAGDRVLCFEEELELYADCHPLSYGQEANVDTLCAGLFAALRELDDPSIHQVYARCPEGDGVAFAVQNRLKKAAAFHVIDAEVEA